MADATKRLLDIIIFGATGFTGKYAVREVVKLAGGKSLSWGVAGRNKSKLQTVLKETGNENGIDLSNIKIVIADVEDEESLLAMAAQTRLIINCAGPFRFFGERVVKACVSTGTHHVDVSGEPEYMEKIQLQYNKLAEEKGIYIISACGFDSIPADLGLVYLSNKFDGVLHWAETYLSASLSENSKVLGCIHYGTWESLVYSVANRNELKTLRKQLFPQRLPMLSPKLKFRPLIHRSDLQQGWCVPFPGADRSVMIRSQQYFYEKERQRPVQIQTYAVFQSLLAVLMTAFVGGIIGLLCQCKIGCSLLLKFPRLFSLGMVSHEGPSKESSENVLFSLTIKGQGWKEKLSEPTDEYSHPMNKKMTVKVSGKNPGYGATCTMLVMSGITILTESSKMPGRGGVFSPGAAFAKTSLINELIDNGVKFEVISS